ncbi:MAG: S8 family serine peptidase [Chitinophagales bacterium]|nr:S8 family serine peptidase [Chitinophagales bacterium]
MNKLKTLLIILCFPLFVIGQQSEEILLKNEAVLLPPNVDVFIEVEISSADVFNGRYYRIIQFHSTPTQDLKAELESQDLHFLDYIPNNAFVISFPSDFKKADLKNYNVRSVVNLSTDYKKDPFLYHADYPEWALRENGIAISLQFYSDIDFESAIQELELRPIKITDTREAVMLVEIEIAIDQIDKILQIPFVKYAEVVPPPPVPEDEPARSLHRVNTLDTDYGAGRHYNGKGIKIAINDDGYVGPHIDFRGRIEQSEVINDITGEHGDMVAGIAGGAGNLNPLNRGMATNVQLKIRSYNASLPNTLNLYLQDTIVLFSSSYSNGCNAGYTSTTQLVDQEIYNNPSLIQTFSAGNSGNSDCGYGAGSSWGNVTGGHKIGKNVIAVGNMDNNGDLQFSSSRGPATDGRIKPDICANGANQISTDPNNAYAPGGGTSAAAPGIAGIMSQLYQAYRDLNGGEYPESSLLKACLLNSAEDRGNPGPDFTYGWGRVNALRAVKMLEDEQYVSGTATQGDYNLHFINVPAGTKEVRVMLYWMDPEGSTLTSKALVNDLDMQLLEPVGSGGVYDPWVLDHTPNAFTLNNPAVRGTDNLNNMEQVTLEDPVSGVYSVGVTASSVPVGPQKYYIVYTLIDDKITVTYPFGGEHFVAGETRKLRWDAFGNSGTFTIEYSTDNGGSWNTISNSIPALSRQLDWTVSNTETSKGLIRISRGGNFPGVSSAPFSIYPVPSNVKVTMVCPTFTRIEWDAVPGAASYEAYQLGNKHMEIKGSSFGNKFTFQETNIGDDDWFAVRAIGPDGEIGRRTIAINKMNFEFNCIQCGIPTNPNTTAIGSDSAIFNWTSAGNAADYRIMLENISGSGGVQEIAVGSNTNSIIARELEAETTYEWTVRTLCNIEDSVSGAAQTQTFTTLKQPIKTTSSIILPNPVNNMATIQFFNPDKTKYKLEIIDVSGKIVISDSELETQEVLVDLSQMSSGMYFYRLSGIKDYNGKFMIRR